MEEEIFADPSIVDKEDYGTYNNFAFSHNELVRLYHLIKTGCLKEDPRWLERHYYKVVKLLKHSSEYLAKKYNDTTYVESKDQILEQLKFTRKQQYREYLLSEDWKYTRGNALEIAGDKCQLCNSTHYLNVHHKTYKNIYNEDQHMDDLIVLCASCHKKFHNIGDKNED